MSKRSLRRNCELQSMFRTFIMSDSSSITNGISACPFTKPGTHKAISLTSFS